MQHQLCYWGLKKFANQKLDFDWRRIRLGQNNWDLDPQDCFNKNRTSQKAPLRRLSNEHASAVFNPTIYMYSNRNPGQHVLNCFYCCFLDLHVIYRYHVFSISERKVNKVPKFFPLELVTCNFHFIFLQFSQVWFVLVWTFAAALTVHHLLSPQSTHSPAHPLNAPHPPSLTFHTAPSLLFHLQPPGLLGFCHVSISYSIFFK